MMFARCSNRHDSLRKRRSNRHDSLRKRRSNRHDSLRKRRLNRHDSLRKRRSGWACHHEGVPGILTPQRERSADVESAVDPDRPWVTIVWNDPINLMSYVTHVFMTVFAYPKAKAEKLMLDVHHLGRATVSSGPRERMELDVATLHGYGLWATLAHDE